MKQVSVAPLQKRKRAHNIKQQNLVAGLLLVAAYSFFSPVVLAGVIARSSIAGSGVGQVDLATGESIGFSDPWLFQAYGVDYGPDGNLYVASRNDNILKFDPVTGTVIDPFFVWRGDARWFRDPEDLIFGPDGNIYASSRLTKSVWKFDGETGDVLSGGFASFPVGPSGLTGAPLGLTFGPDGNLYVSEKNNNTVAKFDGETGALIEVIARTTSSFQISPSGLEFGPDGNLYIGSGSDVLRYDPTTETLSYFLEFIEGRPEIGINVYDLAFGPDDLLYVSETGGGLYQFDISTGDLVDTLSASRPGAKPAWSYIAFKPEPSSIPEPTTLALVALCMAGIGFARKKAA